MEPVTEEEDRRLWRKALIPNNSEGMFVNRRRVSWAEYEQASALPEKPTAPRVPLVPPPSKRQVELIVDGIEQTAVLDADQAEKWDSEIERYERQKSSLLLVSNKQQREYRMKEAAREHAANKRRIAGLLNMWEQALEE